MNINLESLEKVDAGGGEVFILSDSESENLIAGATINDEFPKHVGILKDKWEIAKKDTLLKLAMQKDQYTRNNWWGLVVIFYEGAFRRVDLQIAKCSDCDWEGWAATPVCFDLYIGRKNADELFEEARKLPVLCCPLCEGKLDKHAIWVEQKV